MIRSLHHNFHWNRVNFFQEKRLVCQDAAPEEASLSELVDQKVSQLSLEQLQQMRGGEIIKEAQRIVDEIDQHSNLKAEHELAATELALERLFTMIDPSKKSLLNAASEQEVLGSRLARPYKIEIQRVRENYERELQRSRKLVKKRLDDLRNPHRDYGGGDEYSWAMFFDAGDNIANAPKGSLVGRAREAFLEVNKKAQKAKSGPQKIALQVELSKKRDELEKAIRNDPTILHEKQRERLEGLYARMFESHLESERDSQALKEAQQRYTSGLPDDFDFRTLFLAQQSLKELERQARKKKTRYEDILPYLQPSENREILLPFESFDQIQQVLNEEGKNLFGEHPDKEEIVDMFNSAIYLRNAEAFVKMWSDLESTPSEPTVLMSSEREEDSSTQPSDSVQNEVAEETLAKQEEEPNEADASHQEDEVIDSNDPQRAAEAPDFTMDLEEIGSTNLQTLLTTMVTTNISPKESAQYAERARDDLQTAIDNCVEPHDIASDFSERDPEYVKNLWNFIHDLPEQSKFYTGQKDRVEMNAQGLKIAQLLVDHNLQDDFGITVPTDNLNQEGGKSVNGRAPNRGLKVVEQLQDFLNENLNENIAGLDSLMGADGLWGNNTTTFFFAYLKQECPQCFHQTKNLNNTP